MTSRSKSLSRREGEDGAVPPLLGEPAIPLPAGTLLPGGLPCPGNTCSEVLLPGRPSGASPLSMVPPVVEQKEEGELQDFLSVVSVASPFGAVQTSARQGFFGVSVFPGSLPRSMEWQAFPFSLPQELRVL